MCVFVVVMCVWGGREGVAWYNFVAPGLFLVVDILTTIYKVPTHLTTCYHCYH